MHPLTSRNRAICSRTLAGEPKMIVSRSVDASHEKSPSGAWSPCSCHSFVIEWYQSPWAERVAVSASFVGIRHEDLAERAYLGFRHVAVESALLMLVRLPGLPVIVYILAKLRGWAAANKIVAVLGNIRDALWVVCGIPQRRIRLLQGAQLHRNVLVPVVIAFEVEPFVGHSGDKHRPAPHRRWRVNRQHRHRNRPTRRERRRAQSQFQPSTGKLIQHADFFYKPQGL